MDTRTTFDLTELIRPNIRRLKPYRSARDDFDEDTGTLLDANENSLGPAIEGGGPLHRYPDPYQRKLRQKIADFRGIRPGQVFTGVGSDEAIDLLMRIFGRPGQDRLLITPPTYGMYKVSAEINDLHIDEVLLTEDFQLRPEAILSAAVPETKLLFLCSPNNPTANLMDTASIEQLLEEFNGIVVIDEAYVDFSDQTSWAKRLDEFPNLVVLQTFSKSFGLAGIRLGVALASASIIDLMLKVKAPYNVNRLTLEKGLEAFDNIKRFEANIQQIRAERKRLREQLEIIPQVKTIYPSDANFLLFTIEHAYDVYQQMAEEGVIIRYRGDQPHCDNCLRVTVGTPEENDLFISTLKTVCS